VSNTCALTCSGATPKLCGTQCYAANTCCSNADCPLSAQPASDTLCQTVGGTCTPPTDTVSLTVNYPKNATITQITGTISAPTTKLTTGTASVTSGSATVTGSGTTFTTSFSTAISSVAVTSGGAGYTSAPTVNFSGGGFTTAAAATATIVGGQVTSVTMTSGGVRYTSAPTVSFSGGGPTTAATATAATGLSFSVDDSNWYEISSVSSNTSLTLSTPYSGGSQSGLSSYYESDCNAGAQNCNQTYPFTLPIISGSCGGSSSTICTYTPPANCSTNSSSSTCVAETGCTWLTSGCVGANTVALPVGAFSIAALAYDSLSRVEGSAILPNKIYVLNPVGNNITSPNLNLIRSFPLSSSGDGRCPLNLAEDPYGNVWTVNNVPSNVTLPQTCQNPSGTLTKLVKGASPPYAPFEFKNPAITNPEGIAIDADSTGAGYVWATNAGQQNGIYQLYNSNGVGSSYQCAAAGCDGTTRLTYTAGADNCQDPRGVDIDPNPTPNGGGAFIACQGESGNPGKIIKVDQTNTEASGIPAMVLNDYSDAQPVTLVYARASTPGSAKVLDFDYRCNHEIYVNRSSTSQVNLSVYNVGASDNQLVNPCTNTNNTFSTAGDENPYGLAYDSGGTSYAASTTSGVVLNIEFDGSNDQTGIGCAAQQISSSGGNNQMNEDSANNIASPSPWGVAVDDLFSAGFNPCGTTGSIAQPTIFFSHNTTDRVSRVADGQGQINDYVVGTTHDPGPTGLLFDRQQGVVWVANSQEGSLTQISKTLMLFTNESQTTPPYGSWSGAPSPAAGAACVATQAPGSPSVQIVGYGFDTTTPTNNTVLVAGYMAKVTSVAVTGSSDGVTNSVTGLPVDPLQTTLYVTIPNAPSGISGPVIVANQGGQVVSYCIYTTR